MRAFATTLMAALRRRAKREFGLITARRREADELSKDAMGERLAHLLEAPGRG